MQKKYKIVISDFDGTFLKTDGSVSKNNVIAVNSFISRGGVFVVCTGRMATGISNQLNKIGYKGLFACYNGAEIVDITTNKKLYQNQIENGIATKIVEFIENSHANVQVYCNDVLCVNEINIGTKIYAERNDVTPKIEYPLSNFLKVNKYNTSKILILDKKEVIDGVYEKVKDFAKECLVIKASDNMIEITNKGVHKGLAVEMIAKMFNTSIEDVIAVGDAGNDEPMLQVAGFPIAVGNAQQRIKDIAKVVVPSNDDDAIKYIIDNYCI